MDLHLGDRFAMLVGKVVIGTLVIWGATVVVGPFLKNVRVSVKWSSGEEKTSES